VIAVGLLGLALVVLKEILERPERAHAFYQVNGPQAIYLYSYVEFRRLPDHVRHEVLRSPEAMKWFKRETSRHGGDMFEAYGTRFGKLRHRVSLWVLNLLT
jgi:histidinol-phosphate/aromatic aminotransferase/cobyric acid decarboxylase-like protein